jgi:hypothetical protein
LELDEPENGGIISTSSGLISQSMACRPTSVPTLRPGSEARK